MRRLLAKVCSPTLAMAALSGCGTMANMDGRKYALIDFPHQYQPKPFGGVQRDFIWISNGIIPFVFDLPFSVVGDIVSLPSVLTMPPVEIIKPELPDASQDAPR
jgi:uncharacterized protein YceK